MTSVPLILDGVIAPRLSVIAGVEVEVATDPDTPFAVTTETSVTVPLPLGVTASKPLSARFLLTIVPAPIVILFGMSPEFAIILLVLMI